MTGDLNPPEEARVIPDGEPIEGGAALFEGTLEDARKFVRGLDADQRKEVSVWTPGHVFSVAELLAERPGREHDPKLVEHDLPS